MIPRSFASSAAVAMLCLVAVTGCVGQGGQTPVTTPAASESSAPSTSSTPDPTATDGAADDDAAADATGAARICPDVYIAIWHGLDEGTPDMTKNTGATVGFAEPSVLDGLDVRCTVDFTSIDSPALPAGEPISAALLAGDQTTTAELNDRFTALGYTMKTSDIGYEGVGPLGAVEIELADLSVDEQLVSVSIRG